MNRTNSLKHFLLLVIFIHAFIISNNAFSEAISASSILNRVKRLSKEINQLKKASKNKDINTLFNLAISASSIDIRKHAVREYLSNIPIAFNPSFNKLYSENSPPYLEVREYILSELRSFANSDNRFTNFCLTILSNENNNNCKIAALEFLAENCKGKQMPLITKSMWNNSQADIRIKLLDLISVTIPNDISKRFVLESITDKSFNATKRAIHVAGQMKIKEAISPLFYIVSSKSFDEGYLRKLKIASLRAFSKIDPTNNDIRNIAQSLAKSKFSDLRLEANKLLVSSSRHLKKNDLLNILRGLSSSNLAESQHFRKLLIDSMPDSISDLEKIAKRNFDFFTLDIVAECSMRSGFFTIVKIINERLSNKKLILNSKFSRSREYLMREVLLSADKIINIKQFKPIKITDDSLQTIILFLTKTDTYFKKQKHIWMSNDSLVDDAQLFQALHLWNNHKKNESIKLFNDIQNKYSNYQPLIIPMQSCTIAAANQEAFRCATRASMASYSALLLTELYLEVGEKNKALVTLQKAHIRFKKNKNIVSDEKYDNLRKQYLKKMDSRGGKSLLSNPAIRREMQNQFLTESADIRLMVLLMKCYHEQNFIKEAKDLLTLFQKIWPITCKTLIANLKSLSKNNDNKSILIHLNKFLMPAKSQNIIRYQ